MGLNDAHQLRLRLGMADEDQLAPLALVPLLPTVPRRNPAVPHRDERLSELRFIVVDVETTGTRPWLGDRITEVAAVEVRSGVVGACYETLLNPGIPISPWITRLTGISDGMVAAAPYFPSVCATLLDVIGEKVFVAHNARFDWAFVSMEVERATGLALSGRPLCTVRLARRLVPTLRRRSLDHLANHYGVRIGSRHRAAGDAIATAHVLTRLLEDAAARGCETWGDLDLLAGPASRSRRRPTSLPRPVEDDFTA